MARVRCEQGQGVGEDEHGLGPELPGPTPGHLIHGPRAGHGAGAKENS